MNEMVMTPDVEEKLRQVFKTFNRFMVVMWRLGLGSFMRWRWLSGQIMVITHVGRKSGLRHRTPVNFALHEGYVYCTAGFGQVSDWYRNIQTNPAVELWMPEGWWQATGEDVSETEEAPDRLSDVLVASGFAAYLFGVNPAQYTQDDLKKLLKTYRVVRFKRTGACTGPGGPGDLAWIWPVATLTLLLGRRKR